MASRLQDVIQRDTRANQPLATAVAPGTLYFVTDEGVIERSNGTIWESYSGSGTGNVSGPGSSTDNAIARWNGLTGDAIQDSTPLVEDDGRISTLTDPTNLQDAATKNYVDESIANVNVGGAAQTSFLVSGGQVAWVSNYIFDVSAAQYYIQGVLYSSIAGQITLDASDPTNDRIDVIAVDNNGSIVKVTGTASAQPSEPDIDPGTQLKLAIVFVGASTTQPASANKEVVYYDNAGSPTEWDWTSSGASVVVNSVNNPKSPSTTDIEGTTVAAGVNVSGVIGVGTYDPQTAAYLILYVRSKATWANNRGLSVSLRNAGVLLGSVVNINRTGTFGFLSSNTTDYQLIAIPTVMFAIPAGLEIDEVRITTFGTGHGFYIDDIFFQEGGVVQSNPGITQDQADARYLQRANNLSDLTSPTAATAVLNAMVGDSGAGGVKGLAPAPAAGDAAAGKFLKADGTYAVPPGGGITELTGDVTAGPGSGSQAATLANTAVTPGSYTNADITVDSKGRITAAASGTGGGAGSDIILLEAHTAAGSASLDFTSWYDAAYDIYLIVFDSILPATDAQPLRYLVGTGGSWDTGGIYSGAMQSVNISGGWGSANFGGSQTIGTIVGNTSNTSTAGISGFMYLRGAANTAVHKNLFGKIQYYDGTNWQLIETHSVAARTAAIDELQFKFASGNIASGSIRIYGLINTPGGGASPTVTGTVSFTIDGGGSPIDAGVKGFVRVPVNCTITKATLLSIDASATAGDIVIDVWKDTYANYPPTNADSITSATPPTLSSANKSEDSALTGWTTAITAGDILGFNVDSVATVTKVILTLTVVY